jgi:hypothetical protein
MRTYIHVYTHTHTHTHTHTYIMPACVTHEIHTFYTHVDA